MPLTKLVNGKRVTMDAAEETEIQDEWLAWGPQALSAHKMAKRGEFFAEGVTRIAAQVPDWDSLESIKTVAGIWVSHLATNATVAQTTAKDIYLYVKNTVPPKLAAVTTQAALDAIDPTAADPFGDGSLWPT